MVDIMADLNIPGNDAPVEQAPAVAPPTRTDDKILPLSKWMPIGKSNCVLDVHKPHRNPIFPIVVALLKNTNFFRAFTASSTIPAIYIQQFWDTMCFNTSTGLYSCQLDEQWFNLHKDLLRDALDITPTNDNNPFVAPPSSDTVIEYVNTLGYPSALRNVSAMNNLATAARRKKKTTHLLIPSVRFTKLIIHHLRTKHNIHPRTRSPLHYSHEESILNTLRFVGKDGREIFGMPIPNALLIDEIKGAPYYGDYQEHVAKYQQFLDAEFGKAEEGGATDSSNATKVTKPKAAKKQKLVKETPNEPSPAKRSKGGLVGKRRKPKSLLKLVDEPSDEGVPVEDHAHTDEEADLQQALELSLKEQSKRTKGPPRLVVLREPDSGKYQPLPEVQEKGKEKVVDEQATHDLLTLQTPMKKSHVDQFIFQRRPSMHTEPTGQADSPSLDAGPNPGEQNKGQAGLNPGIQDEGQAGSNPGDAVESKPQPSHGVHAGPNREHMDFEATDASSQQKPKQMDGEFTTTAYPNVQENLKLPTKDQVILEEPASSIRTLSSLENLDKDLSFIDQFFMKKPHEEESGKTNAKIEVQSWFQSPFTKTLPR
ncbi:copia protein, partial [Tanacetum coccineum]